MAVLRMIASDHARLQRHLFPGDGLEAAALLICAVSGWGRQQLLVHEVIMVPYQSCPVRTETRLTWPGVYLERAVDAADKIGGSIILMHSHPGGFYGFSDLDDASDAETMPVLQAGVTDPKPLHGSAIMTPDGRVMCRLYDRQMKTSNCAPVWSIGHDIVDLASEPRSKVLAYTSDMREDLKRHTAVIVGVSGTGSIVAEILARLGVGRLILVDFDRIEERNLNRILNAAPEDVGRFKTHVVRDAIKTFRPETKVETFETMIDAPATLIASSDATIMFSCVDSMEGRYFCDLMVEAFLCPLIDLGVMIPTRKRADDVEIADVCGRIDFVRPGGVSLWARGEITGEGLSAEYIKRTNPDAHARQVEEGYLQGVPEEAPSVISLNMRAASAAVQEWLSRLYAVRHLPNEGYSKTYFSLAAGEEEYSSEAEMGAAERSALFARGLQEPLLGKIKTSDLERSAA